MVFLSTGRGVPTITECPNISPYWKILGRLLESQIQTGKNNILQEFLQTSPISKCTTYIITFLGASINSFLSLLQGNVKIKDEA